MRRCLTLLALILWWPAAALAEGRLAIVIDDLGYSAALGERSLALPGAFTYAVLPRSPQGPRLARRGAALNKEIIIHTPMSNTRGLPLDRGALRGEMSYADFMLTLEGNLEAIPQARGLNNHMGSQLTQEPRAMGWLMQRLGERGLYFLDSRTTAQSRAWETARHYGVPSLKRDVFLDNDRSPDKIAEQLAQAIELARTEGRALAIGHPYPETLAVLETIGPALERAGVALVPVSELVAGKEPAPTGASGLCLAPPMTLWRPPQPVEPTAPPPLVLSLDSHFR